jgi:hypothetical protein
METSLGIQRLIFNQYYTCIRRKINILYVILTCFLHGVSARRGGIERPAAFSDEEFRFGNAADSIIPENVV